MQESALDFQPELEAHIKKLKDRRYRVTPQRMAILKILALSKNHPSVEQAYEQVKTEFPTTSLATVTKTVTKLKEEWEVEELGFANDNSRYAWKHCPPLTRI